MKRLFLATALLLSTLFLAAFTNLKVNARNTESLDASLQAMLKPLSQKERTELMEALFLVAYVSAGETGSNFWGSNTPEGKIKHQDYTVNKSAKVYISDRRMDDNVKRTNGWGDVKGRTRQESLYRFIDLYGEYVDGKSGHKLIKEARTIRARRGVNAAVADSAFMVKEIAGVQKNIRIWEAEATSIRDLVKPHTYPVPKGSGNFVVTKCDAKIASAKLYLRALQAGGVTQDNISKSRGGYRSSRPENTCNGKAIKEAATRTFGRPLPSSQTRERRMSSFQYNYVRFIKPGNSIFSVIGNVQPPPAPPDNTERLNNALDLIRLVETKNFKVMHTSTGDIISADVRVKIHNLQGKDIRRILYVVAIAPKAQRDALVAFDARAPSWKERAPLKGDLISSSGLIKNSAPKNVTLPERQSDYVFTPYVKSIKYMDGTSEVFVKRFSEIKPLVIAKTK